MALCAALFGCGGGDPADGAGASDKLYWNVQLVGTGAAKPDATTTDINRLFDDGSVLYRRAEGGDRAVTLRSASGASRVLELPPADATTTFGYLTYYEDDDNFGGISSTGGYVVVDGVLSKCSEKLGGGCGPRGKLPDGSILVVDTNEQGNTLLQSWVPGRNDALDVADIIYQANAANGNSAAFSRLAEDGTILMLPFMPGGSLSGVVSNQIVVLVNGEPVALDSTQFNHGEPVDPSNEAILGQAVVGITRTGAILGMKNGQPVLKTGDDYDVVSEDKGSPLAAGPSGDTVYQLRTGPYRYRWQGKTYDLDTTAWTAVAGPFIEATGRDIVDINASGQILFYGAARTGDLGVRLYLATPTTSPPPPHRYAHLEFSAVSGGAAPKNIDIDAPGSVKGSLTDAGLSLSVRAPSTKAGQTRALTVVMTLPAGSISIGEPLPAITTVTPAGPLIATVSYADSPSSALAASGHVIVTEDNDQTFKLSFDEVVMKDTKTGDTFSVAGYAEAEK